MKFSKIHPTLTQDPWVRFFARMDEIHAFNETADRPTCMKCREVVPCDTMRAFHVYAMETRGGWI